VNAFVVAFVRETSPCSKFAYKKTSKQFNFEAIPRAMNDFVSAGLQAVIGGENCTVEYFVWFLTVFFFNGVQRRIFTATLRRLLSAHGTGQPCFKI
jgi:hypothetical protein